VDRSGRHYTTVGGERRDYPTYLLRRSFRDEHGQLRKETLANLSALPEEAIAALRKILKGATLVDAEEAFETERSVPHGNAAAAHVMASKLGLQKLLGPACRGRDIAYALIVSRAVAALAVPRIPERGPVTPAQRSAQAKAKDSNKYNLDALPVRKYGDLLGHLSTLDRQTINFNGQRIEKLTTPTPVQRRAFELLGAPVPLTLR